MRKTVLIFCLLIVSASLFGQEVLVLTKKTNGKEKIIEQGKKIKIWTKDGSVYKGFFTINKDSLLITDKGTFSIEDIEIISKKSTGVKIAGGALTGVGGFATFGLGYATFNIIADGGLALLALIVAVPVDAVAIALTTTGILMLTTGRKFKNTKWDYSTRINGDHKN